MITKICPKCQERKNIVDFWKDKYTKDGYGYYCKDCQRTNNKKSYQRNRKKRLEASKIYKEKNKEYYNEYSKKYYQDNKQRIIKVKKEYRIKHWHRLWAGNSIRNHKIQGFVSKITIDFIEELALKTKYCPICDVKLKWEIDKGFKDNSPTLDRIDSGKELNNNSVWIICRKCNATKLNRTLKELYKWCKNFINFYNGG